MANNLCEEIEDGVNSHVESWAAWHDEGPPPPMVVLNKLIK